MLADGRRVLTQSPFLQALGRHRRANVRRERNADLPSILQGKAIEPFVTPAIRAKGRPITFKLPNGGRASGYDAELLPEVCEVYLSARDADALPYQQKHIAKQAEIIMRGLARVGIIALVDEATGYQEVRARDALARILEAFIAKELQAYVKTFPPEFYGELFRLRGLEYPSESVKRPQYFGHLTNDIVYKRLAPGVLDELKRVTPRDEKGRAKTKYFQRLTSNLGYPKLREHLGSVVTLMKLSRDWKDFERKLDQIHPRMGTRSRCRSRTSRGYDSADQRAAAAFLAASLRCFGVMFSARALPPFNPPLRPSSTAAAFFPVSSGVSSTSPVAMSTTSFASWLVSWGACVTAQAWTRSVARHPPTLTSTTRVGRLDSAGHRHLAVTGGLVSEVLTEHGFLPLVIGP